MMKSEYDIFWEKLSKAYPVSKWGMRLPIAKQVEFFEHLDLEVVMTDLDSIIQEVFRKHDEAYHLVKESHHELFPEMYEWHYTGVVRCDCMFDQNWDLKLVELNTKWPDGLLLHDYTYAALSWEDCRLHLDMFLSMFSKDEHIFILYKEHPFVDQHYLEYEKLKEHGFSVDIGTFDDLTFEDNFVYSNWKNVQIFRLSMSPGRFSWEQLELLKKYDIKFINTFDLAAFWDKSLLEGLGHEMIMKTEILDSSNADKVKVSKGKYVIKPTSLDEWKGVFLWIDVEQNDREQLIDENLGRQYLVQEYISIQKKTVSIYDNGILRDDELYFDFCPHLFYRHWELTGMGHVLMRYSTKKILNVLQWGWIGYHRINF